MFPAARVASLRNPHAGDQAVAVKLRDDPDCVGTHEALPDNSPLRCYIEVYAIIASV